MLDDVKNQVLKLSYKNKKWSTENIKIGDSNGNEAVTTLSRNSSQVYFGYTDFLTPTAVYYYDGAKKEAPKLVLKTPERFNSKNLKISQYKVTSKDGTKIPYFVVSNKDLKLDGKNPTLIYGYGGFEISMTSIYSGSIGKAWLEKGGVYVLSNLRGGGEYGPEWHKGVLGLKRHKVYEDFYAVTEDIIHKKISSPDYLGIKGGSNGGLLTSVAFTQR